jgi:methylated-DNA-protein-cysteine methyltransferase related protein
MAVSGAYARIKSDVVAIVMKIPAGRLATHGAISLHLKVFSRHVVYILETLDEVERETVPWWRVVANGGAIGRHQRRDDQMQRLRCEGCAVAPAGIVQDFAERAVRDLTAPMAAVAIAPLDQNGKPSRSRGMKGRPGSSL